MTTVLTALRAVSREAERAYPQHPGPWMATSTAENTADPDEYIGGGGGGGGGRKKRAVKRTVKPQAPKPPTPHGMGRGGGQGGPSPAGFRGWGSSKSSSRDVGGGGGGGGGGGSGIEALSLDAISEGGGDGWGGDAALPESPSGTKRGSGGSNGGGGSGDGEWYVEELHYTPILTFSVWWRDPRDSHIHREMTFFTVLSFKT